MDVAIKITLFMNSCNPVITTLHCRAVIKVQRLKIIQKIFTWNHARKLFSLKFCLAKFSCE